MKALDVLLWMVIAAIAVCVWKYRELLQDWVVGEEDTLSPLGAL